MDRDRWRVPVGEEGEGAVAELVRRQAPEGAFAAPDQLPNRQIDDLESVTPSAPLLYVYLGPAVGPGHRLQPRPTHQRHRPQPLLRRQPHEYHRKNLRIQPLPPPPLHLLIHFIVTYPLVDTATHISLSVCVCVCVYGFLSLHFFPFSL